MGLQQTFGCSAFLSDFCSMELIKKYFPELTPDAEKAYAAVFDLYKEWNEKINVISRKDIENLYERHILHSLAIAKFIRFKPGSSIIDLGSGGGFPAIPLAIMFPDCHFIFVDATGKKVKVIKEISDALKLQNVNPVHGRGESIKEKFDFVVSRAVADISTTYNWMSAKFKQKHINAYPNGFIFLKGGDVEAETRPFKDSVIVTQISDYFEEEWFCEKKIVYISL